LKFGWFISNRAYRALQLHPRTPALYIIAASHELNHMSPSAARALLQRGLRLNADSVDMWKEYVRMEMGFVEGMRRRWTVLGIHEEDHPIAEAETTAKEDMAPLTPEEIAAEKGGDEGERARQAIMDGAIVKSVILSAVKGPSVIPLQRFKLSWTTALPSISLFSALEVLIRSYPSQERLRTALLDHLYSVLKDTLQDDPHAVKMLATRKLRELTSQENSDDSAMADGEEFIDALQAANESFSAAVGAGSTNASGMADVYVEFVEEWCKLPTLDPNLVSLISRSSCISA
jgi:U3 small nucleolar RNA-associated protein 6